MDVVGVHDFAVEMITSTSRKTYDPVKKTLDDLGIEPASAEDVHNLTRLHVAMTLIYALLVIVSISLLATGGGTRVDAGYVFVTGHGDAVIEARSTSVAQAFVPIIASLLGIGHMVMAASRAQDIASVARVGWSPVMAATRALVNPFLCAQLALVARIADVEKVYLLMLAVLVATTVDQVSAGIAAARAKIETMVSEEVASSLSTVVKASQVASGAMWVGVWVVLLTNAVWEAGNGGAGVPAYTVPVELVVLAFFLAGKAHSIMILTGRGCTARSFFVRELVSAAGMLALVIMTMLIGLV